YRMVTWTNKPNLSTFSGLKFPPIDAFDRYGHLVRSLDCNTLELHHDYLIPNCNQLTVIKVMDHVEATTLPLLQLNKATVGFIHLALACQYKKTRSLKEQHALLLVLEECVSLDRLWLENVLMDGRDSSAEKLKEISKRLEPLARTIYSDRFYGIVRRLTELGVRGDVIRVAPDPKEVFYRLHKLSLLNSSLTYKDQVQLISQCQYLTHLQLLLTRRNLSQSDPSDHRPYAYNAIEYSLLEAENEGIGLSKLEACPISHLDISGSTLLDTEIATLLIHLPWLRSFVAQNTRMGSETVRELTVGSHSSALEMLDVRDTKELKSIEVQHILSGCSGLLRFYATSVTGRDVLLTSVVLSTVHGWACLGLEELYLSFIEIPPKVNEQDACSFHQRLIYEQLAKLKQLRILSLGGDSKGSTWLRTKTLDLSLAGGLDKLEPLKNLREINFSYMFHKVTIVEVEWMLAHWPRLSKVTGRIGAVAVKDGQAGTKWQGMCVEDQELYLQRKYPHVQFSER
ncbi:hypothetical protein BGZ94_002488, partial [Podila epigama]